MPIFNKTIEKVDYNDPQKALKKMYNHIKYIQEQLEYTLMNLDSRNVTEINTGDTVIKDPGGNTVLSTGISLTGKNGESFQAGPTNGTFTFSVKGKGGEQTLYMDSTGKLIITKNTKLAIDCGEW